MSKPETLAPMFREIARNLSAAAERIETVGEAAALRELPARGRSMHCAGAVIDGKKSGCSGKVQSFQLESGAMCVTGLCAHCARREREHRDSLAHVAEQRAEQVKNQSKGLTGKVRQVSR